MNRLERINDMMRYLNDKKAFNLKDIMNRYAISKSTALRDIQSLEKVGMPIFSNTGRNGHYGILPNRLLSPIIFTTEEVQALYFSMQILNDYQSTPFHINLEKLKQKFEGCIAAERIEALRKMESVFSLRNWQQHNECPCLGDVLQMAVQENICEVCYQKGAILKQYVVQFFRITSAYGQWYATAYNCQTQKPHVFRCDRIQSVRPSEAYKPKPLAELRASLRVLFRDKTAVDFAAKISHKGVDLFHKEHYPSMALYQEAGAWYIRGFYNQGEEAFIANYFLMYGEAILAIEPLALHELILKRLSVLTNHFVAQQERTD